MNNEINFEEFIKNIDCTIYEKIDVDNWNISVEVVLDVVDYYTLQRFTIPKCENRMEALKS